MADKEQSAEGKWEEAYSRGQEAQAFLRALKDGPHHYYALLLDEIHKEIQERIDALTPTQTQEFTILQAQKQCLFLPLDRVVADIQAGKYAKDQMDGKTEGGIL